MSRKEAQTNQLITHGSVTLKVYEVIPTHAQAGS